MFEKSPKRPKNRNPGKTCADCEHHICGTQCMHKPKMRCRGFCIAKHRLKKCSISSKMCRDFKQIEWRMTV